MAMRRRKMSRREILELAAASGALSLLPAAGTAANPTPTPCVSTNPTDEAEVIGNLLWQAFKLGAGMSGPLPCHIEKAGRQRSEQKVRDNLKKHGRKDFPYFQTANCAFYAGQKAADLAKGKDISEQNFRDAWDYVSIHMSEAKDRLCRLQGADFEISGGAC